VNFNHLKQYKSEKKFPQNLIKSWVVTLYQIHQQSLWEFIPRQGTATYARCLPRSAAPLALMLASARRGHLERNATTLLQAAHLCNVRANLAAKMEATTGEKKAFNPGL
jgi:hypothetical protein